MGREPTSLGDTVVLSSIMMREHTSNTKSMFTFKTLFATGEFYYSRGEVKLDAGIRVNFNVVPPPIFHNCHNYFFTRTEYNARLI